MKTRDLLRELVAAGCSFVRQRHGSHQAWVTPAGRVLVIPVKGRGVVVSARVLFHVRRALEAEGLPFEAFA